MMSTQPKQRLSLSINPVDLQNQPTDDSCPVHSPCVNLDSASLLDQDFCIERIREHVLSELLMNSIMSPDDFILGMIDLLGDMSRSPKIQAELNPMIEPIIDYELWGIQNRLKFEELCRTIHLSIEPFTISEKVLVLNLLQNQGSILHAVRLVAGGMTTTEYEAAACFMEGVMPRRQHKEETSVCDCVHARTGSSEPHSI